MPFSTKYFRSLSTKSEITQRGNRRLLCTSLKTSKIFRCSPPNNENQRLLSKPPRLCQNDRPDLKMIQTWWRTFGIDAVLFQTNPTTADNNETTSRRTGLDLQTLLWRLRKVGFWGYQKPSTYHGLGEWPGQGEQQRVHPWVSMDGREHHVSRVHGIRSDPSWGEATVQLIGEEDIAELGSVISQHGPIVTLWWREAAEVKFPWGIVNICKSETQKARHRIRKMQLLTGL